MKKNKHSQNFFRLRQAEPKETLSKFFSPLAGRTERNTPKFFSPAANKTRKKISEMYAGDHLKVLKHTHIKANLQFQDFCFFFGEIFPPKFFRMRRAKIIRED